MAAPAQDSGFSVAEAAAACGMTVGQVRGFIRREVIAPARGERGEYRLSFRDVVVLRRARGLAERAPARRVTAALRTLARRDPDAVSSMHLEADESGVVVREPGAIWRPESGQLLLDFDAAPPAASDPTPTATSVAKVVSIGRAAPSQTGELEAIDGMCDEATSLEAGCPSAAEAAYREALAADPDHRGSCINLGRLLHERGDPQAAAALYRRVLAARPDDPTALFNLAVALEDLGQPAQALTLYQQVIGQDPRCGDAHYNAARLCEQAGDQVGALRHLRHYRALIKAD